ncbi:Carboxypeptidase G2 [Bosea sp. 62]|uniref:glutamate carboxypeptidase n=1 Tax=unclassified Bosea (in: a-proteobacteria) TaxID=2653178 RepID=UPI001253F401|nr:MULTISPECIES: glutamate carboxypeptidase [unclassified Bosea (in: a-proteobacteria)]CAD5293616.1 Carboxypeptidase G2 [Bosea sp. 7B]CAD5298380.1 Carboxypeptidase G2 [Bosea sp. 21B]CAD5298550.1 Carboxypeptidase G2 [Bosea sp. 46]VVT61457.1 Carboxypeptidase G2 [Bosea sp. EC-HK365B]VXB14195.1 Carboxypeptidase G2 [Bosea sp. 127]
MSGIETLRRAAVGILMLAAVPALAAPQKPVLDAAEAEKPAYLETLKALVSIESGSRDAQGLATIASLIAERLKALGGETELIDSAEPTRSPAKIALARFKGSGTRKILLLAHMDTVYAKGMLAQQPFRIEGDKAYGLGIADDKHGVALILHTVALLNTLAARDYGTLTVLINGDEEIGSAGSRALITRLAAEQDAVFSCEGSGIGQDTLRLATSGVGSVQLKVTGRASHAGSSPEMGRNALYELAHQILQMRDLSKPEMGLKLNWTLASAGSVSNAIPAEAKAQGDMRALRMADFDLIEAAVKERIQNKLIPDTVVEATFTRGRPPLAPTEASKDLGAHAKRVFGEIGRPLTIAERASGGGTDAAYAALQAKGPVIEGFGLRGFGSHSNQNEYVALDSIVPRLYLLARMITDVSRGEAK